MPYDKHGNWQDSDNDSTHVTPAHIVGEWEEGTSITFSGEASEGFADRVMNMQHWYVRITTLTGEIVDGSLVPTKDIGWHDAVTWLPVDEGGMAIEDAEPRSERVRDIYVY